MSITATRTEYTIGFIFGILAIIAGVALVFYQFSTQGYIFNFPPSDPYSIFAGWAVLGVISLAVGALLVYTTYKIFIPLKENNFQSAKICPNCGAIVAQDAVVCEKCKQPIDTSTQ